MDFIERDYNIIKQKIFKGEAHLISEGETDLLGACTKAADSSVTTNQPNSSTKAKPRAYSLKQSYLTGVLNNLKAKVVEKNSIEAFIENKIKRYVGMTQFEILESLGIKTNKVPKNISKMVIDRIGGKENHLKKIEPFNKVNFLLKTSPVDKNSRLLERLSFHNIDQSDFSEKWENSYWKNYFEEQTIYLFMFEGSSIIKNGNRKLVGFKKVVFSENDIDNFGKTYDLIKKAIEKKDIRILPRPKYFENQYLVLAPKGVKGDKAYLDFFKSNKTKACLMLEKEFISQKLVLIPNNLHQSSLS
jgi:hypothetical protein